MFKSKIATIIAVTALVVAVLGASPLGHAASRFVLPANSVGAAQLKKNAVTGKKLADNAVTGAKVKDGSLLAADFKAGQLPAGPKGDPGARGLEGIPGQTGEKGDPGAAGSAVGYAHVVVTAGGAAVDASRSKNVSQAQVSRKMQGITCFSGLPFDPKNATVTTDASFGPGIQNATVALEPDAGVITLCGGAGQALVATGQGNTTVDTAYYVVFN